MPCPACKIPYVSHPKCDACGILIGPEHLETRLTPFMDHMICGECNRDGPLTRKTLARNWEEFIRGIPIERIEAERDRIERGQRRFA